MKNLPKLLVLAAAVSALLLLTGCPKKPDRSTPLDTSMGQQTAPTVTPVDLSAVADQNTLLTPRDGSMEEVEAGKPGYQVAEMQSVYFDFDRSAVAARERPKIEAAVKWMNANAGKRVVLEGHCDWRGTAEYNLGLGDRRANAVKKYLESLGIDSKRLEIISKGDIDAKEGGSDADMAKDRRVDFYVIKTP